MKTIKEMTEIMLAYESGEQIENQYKGEWILCEKPKWNWSICDYRVKPKPKYAPFSTAE